MQNYLTKRNIIIAVVVLAVIIGVLVYFGRRSTTSTGGDGGGGFFGGLFPSSPPPSSTSDVESPKTSDVIPGGGEQISQAGPLPISPDAAKNLPIGALIKLTDGVVSSILPQSGGIVKYHKNTAENLGHLFERKADGTSDEKRLSNFTIPQILKVVWASDAKRAIVFYSIGEELRKLLVDYSNPQTPKTNFLPNSISDAVFSPNGASMAFINDLGDTKNIFTATADFKNQKKVMDNAIPDLELMWPTASTLSIKTKSSYAVPGFLYSISVSSGALAKIVEGSGIDAIWNTDGSGVLYSSANSGGAMQNLKFYDIKSGKTQDLGLRTIAEKCAFLKTQKNLALCGVPHSRQSINSSLKYPDDWWKGKIIFQDDFFAVDAAKGTASGFSQTFLDVVMPKSLPDDSFLLFQDKTTGEMWSLKLK